MGTRSDTNIYFAESQSAAMSASAAPGSSHGSANGHHDQQITLKSITVDASRRGVCIGEKWVRLTSGEFELIWILAARAGDVVSRDDMIPSVRGFEYNGLDRTIDLRVARLRRKLGDSAKAPTLIHSIRGIGYMLTP